MIKNATATTLPSKVEPCDPSLLLLKKSERAFTRVARELPRGLTETHCVFEVRCRGKVLDESNDIAQLDV